MTQELKECPFCGVIPIKTVCFGMKSLEHPPCKPNDYQCPLRKMVISIDIWNTRPSDNKDGLVAVDEKLINCLRWIATQDMTYAEIRNFCRKEIYLYEKSKGII